MPDLHGVVQGRGGWKRQEVGFFFFYIANQPSKNRRENAQADGQQEKLMMVSTYDFFSFSVLLFDQRVHLTFFLTNCGIFFGAHVVVHCCAG